MFKLMCAVALSILAAGAAMADVSAVPAATATGLGTFLTSTVQPVVASLIGTLLPILIALGCRWISKTTRIAISDASQAKLEYIAEKSVLSVEEKAVSSLKLSGEKWPAYIKHQQAVDQILTLAPSLSADQADMLVHATLAKIPGLGSTGILGATSGTALVGVSTAPDATSAATAAADPAATADAAASPTVPAPAPATPSPLDSFVDLLANMVASKLPAATATSAPDAPAAPGPDAADATDASPASATGVTGNGGFVRMPIVLAALAVSASLMFLGCAGTNQAQVQQDIQTGEQVVSDVLTVANGLCTQGTIPAATCTKIKSGELALTDVEQIVAPFVQPVAQ